MVSGAFGHGRDAPPPAMGLLLIFLGGTFILLGWTVATLLLVAGQRLRKRRSYNFCFVVAAISCAFAPMGTVLGVFTIIVLSRPTVKAIFASRSAAPPTQP
jgi:hypothetical protein